MYIYTYINIKREKFILTLIILADDGILILETEVKR